MGALIVVEFLAVAGLIGVMYYMVMPAFFNLKETFNASVDDERALQFGYTLYQICGIFPILFVGIAFLHAHAKGTRERSADQFG